MSELTEWRWVFETFIRLGSHQGYVSTRIYFEININVVYGQSHIPLLLFCIIDLYDTEEKVFYLSN